jgi:hypothetical protein
MANTFLTTHMAVSGPPLLQEHEGSHMADADVFPRWLYPAGGPTEPDYGGKCFDSKEALDAAEGQWFPTPQEAQAAGTRQPRAAEAPDAEEEHPTRRSHR